MKPETMTGNSQFQPVETCIKAATAIGGADINAVRRVRLRRLMVAAGGFLCALVAAAGAFCYNGSRTVSFHYADYVDSFGLPQGIFPLKESELAHRHVHYRFEYRGFQRGKSPHADSAGWCVWNMLGFRRRLVRVVQANSHGYPRKWDHTEYADRPQIQDFKYDRDLRLREIRYGRYNGEGREPHLEKRLELSNARGVTNGLIEAFVSEDRLDKAFAKASLTTADSDALGEKSEITKYLVQRDGSGRIARCLFYNGDSNASDADGIYGFQYEFDSLGRPTAQWYLFREGDGFGCRANKRGVAGRKYEYAGRNMRKAEYVDPEGRPVPGPHGWMVCIDEFDEYDNNTKSTFYDENGNVALSADGFAGYRAEYDTFGDQVRWVCLGTDGKPTLLKDGYAESRQEYDERGNVTRVSYFSVDGKPTLHNDGIAGFRTEYDERGNMTKQFCFGVDGKPTLHKDGSVGWIAEYDERGNVTKRLYFGVDGKPVLCKDGFAEMRSEYDARGNMTKQLYFDVDGNPTLNKYGYTEARWGYDVRGNVTSESYFGVDGNPTLDKDGYVETRWEYDARGNRTHESYFDVEGRPTRLNTAGVAGCAAEYNECGNMTKQLYFDVDGKPMLLKNGYAEVRWEYDVRGNMTRVSYFDVDGRPTLHKDGYAEARYTYEQDGTVATVGYFDVSGNKITLR